MPRTERETQMATCLKSCEDVLKEALLTAYGRGVATTFGGSPETALHALTESVRACLARANSSSGRGTK